MTSPDDRLATELRSLARHLDIPPATPEDAMRQGRSQRILSGLGSGLAVVAVAILAVVLVGRTDTTPGGNAVADPAAAAPTTGNETASDGTPSTDTTAAPSDADALAAADAWFEAFGAGDLDAMVALLAPDAQPEGDREQWMRVQTFKHAEGALPVDVSCEVQGREEVEVKVRCEYGDHEYLARAVGEGPVPNVVTMRIGAQGITRLARGFGPPDYNHVDSPFQLWMDEVHPDEINLECCDFDSVEHAHQVGLANRQYADEWAAFLDESGCSFSNYTCQSDYAATQS